MPGNSAIGPARPRVILAQRRVRLSTERVRMSGIRRGNRFPFHTREDPTHSILDGVKMAVRIARSGEEGDMA